MFGFDFFICVWRRIWVSKVRGERDARCVVRRPIHFYSREWKRLKFLFRRSNYPLKELCFLNSTNYQLLWMFWKRTWLYGHLLRNCAWATGHFFRHTQSSCFAQLQGVQPRFDWHVNDDAFREKCRNYQSSTSNMLKRRKKAKANCPTLICRWLMMAIANRSKLLMSNQQRSNATFYIMWLTLKWAGDYQHNHRCHQVRPLALRLHLHAQCLILNQYCGECAIDLHTSIFRRSKWKQCKTCHHRHWNAHKYIWVRMTVSYMLLSAATFRHCRETMGHQMHICRFLYTPRGHQFYYSSIRLLSGGRNAQVPWMEHTSTAAMSVSNLICVMMIAV